jgi:hypothetical protein
VFGVWAKLALFDKPDCAKNRTKDRAPIIEIDSCNLLLMTILRVTISFNGL